MIALCATCARDAPTTTDECASWCSACGRWIRPGAALAYVPGAARVEPPGCVITLALDARLERVARELGLGWLGPDSITPLLAGGVP